MKHLFIDSYYSEIDCRDVNFDCIDGFYEVVCEDENQFIADVEKTYREYKDAYQDTDESVNSLGMILEELVSHGKIKEYKVCKCLKFDCDYGNFKNI